MGDHVVGDEEAAGDQAGERELEIGAVARAVGVEEDKIERSWERGQRVGGRAFPHFDPGGDPGPPEILPCEAGLVRVALERDDAPAGRPRRVGEPDGRVAVRGADLREAAKAGIEGFVRTVAVQLGPQGVRINAIAPGTVWTPMVEGLGPEARERRRKASPLGTEGTGWDVGWGAVYLASDESRWVTGHVLVIDAGLTATTR